MNPAPTLEDAIQEELQPTSDSGLRRLPLVNYEDGTPVVVERKKRMVGNIPIEPWENHKLQPAIYMLSLERIDLKAEFGVLEYVKPATCESRRFEVRLKEELRRKTLDAVEAVKDLIEGEKPIPTTNRHKRERCNFADKCHWPLIRERERLN
jgi:CRISPR/Cas system-associated exonuclease Cas4 (RecB family)